MTTLLKFDSRKARHRAVYLALRERNRTRSAIWTCFGKLPSSATRTELLLPTLAVEADGTTRGEGTDFQPLRGVETQYAFALRGRHFIEPKCGWVIGSSGHLERDSFPYSDWSDFAGNLLSKPSVIRAANLAVRSRQHHSSVISLRSAWDDNYFHFFNDVLGRLRMLDQLAIPSNVPIVVAGSLAGRPYFEEAAAAGVFGERAVICQRPDLMTSADEVFVLKRRAGDIRDYDYFLDRLALGAPSHEPRRRLFLTRSAARGRTLTNGDEVRDLCRRYGFDAIDTDGMSLSEQANLFGSASHVVGVHSAGLVNIMFARGKPLSLIEILPPGPIPVGWNAINEPKTDFEFLCDSYGFNYQSLNGESSGNYYDRALNFTVDTFALEQALERSVQTESRVAGLSPR